MTSPPDQPLAPVHAQRQSTTLIARATGLLTHNDKITAVRGDHVVELAIPLVVVAGSRSERRMSRGVEGPTIRR